MPAPALEFVGTAAATASNKAIALCISASATAFWAAAEVLEHPMFRGGMPIGLLCGPSGILVPPIDGKGRAVGGAVVQVMVVRVESHSGMRSGS